MLPISETDQIQALGSEEYSQRRLQISGRVRWTIWLFYTLAWTAALLMPAPEILARAFLVPRFVSHQDFNDMGPPMTIAAKVLHVSAYAILAVLSGWLPVQRRWRWLLLAFLSAHGFATEYLQNFAVDRHPSLGDVGLDHAGVILGLAVSWKWWLRRP